MVSFDRIALNPMKCSGYGAVNDGLIPFNKPKHKGEKNNMKYNPKNELMVLMAIKELKEATTEEICNYVNGKWQVEIDGKDLVRYVRRWKKGKIVAANLVGNDWVYSLRDIPWYPEAQMIHVVKPDVSESEAIVFLENYDQELKARGYALEREPDIRDYETYDITLEVVDRIAGGQIEGAEENDAENRLLIFPREERRLVIPRSWIKGWFRDNARLINMTPSIKYTLGVSKGEFLEQPTVEKKTVIGKKGPQTHETIGKGAKFTFTLNYPTHGTKIKTADDLEKFFHKVEKAPIRGFGAYDTQFGGGVKLVEMKPLD